MTENVDENWNQHLEQLKQRKGFDTYSELAKFLGLSKQSMTNVRNGHQALPFNAKLTVMLELGVELTSDDYAGLFPDRTRATIGKKVGAIFDPSGGEELHSNFWVEKIDELERRLAVPPEEEVSDAELARALGIGQSMISQERAGRGGLSSVAKFKILDKLGYAAARSLLLDLLPPKIGKRIAELDNLRFKKRGRG